MAGQGAPRRIEVARLPHDIVALIDALPPGENLLLTRDGEPIATISGTPRTAGGRATEHPPPASGNVTVVVTAMKLSESARASLSGQLGGDYLVLDLKSAPESADVLLVPPISPQLIAGLRSQFPKARVIIAEIEDEELGVRYDGPVRRLLDAGADTYFPSGSIPHLARRLDRTVTHFDNQLTGATPAPLVLESPRDHDSPAGG
ncbi:hypothetical protein [Amycolatopsis samaneae]|uniref:Prevent-host-death family protein n=1 Tax=Amycolatopsis samaneae TaxID=664691 RepID=A0ABW5G6S8_9PSEU